jgi:hypothetical protein
VTMDWDRITQTGARTPGVRADPARSCGVCGGHSPRLRTGKEVPLADTKGGDKLVVLLRMLGASFSEGTARQVPSEMHTFQPYWGKPAVRNEGGGGGNGGIIRSPIRATALLSLWVSGSIAGS